MADTFIVERSATIAAPAERIYTEVADFHRWESWSPWADIDPDMETTYSGPEHGVGAQYAWSGNRKAGQGSMQIIEAHEPRQVVIDLRFDKPFKSQNTTTFHLEPQGESTRVVWSMVGPNTLMTKAMGLVGFTMDKMVGKDFEKGLTRLKQHTERAAT